MMHDGADMRHGIVNGAEATVSPCLCIQRGGSQRRHGVTLKTSNTLRRIQFLCADTLTYSALRLCERLVWYFRGSNLLPKAALRLHKGDTLLWITTSPSWAFCVIFNAAMNLYSAERIEQTQLASLFNFSALQESWGEVRSCSQAAYFLLTRRNKGSQLTTSAFFPNQSTKAKSIKAKSEPSRFILLLFCTEKPVFSSLSMVRNTEWKYSTELFSYYTITVTKSLTLFSTVSEASFWNECRWLSAHSCLATREQIHIFWETFFLDLLWKYLIPAC